MTEPKILVIDDEFPVRYLVEHQLRRRGFEVMSARDGASGIRAAQSHQPDLIVLDIMMPQMDGFEVCAKIRDNPNTSEIPIIFLTALVTKEHKLRAYEVGADDYVVKPFQADELVAHITAVLRRNTPIIAREEPPEPAAPAPHERRARIISLYSPKGGVGTTTMAIQLSEAAALRENQPAILIDLDLPLGGIAPTLSLYTKQHIFTLLQEPIEEIDINRVKYHSQRHRANLWVIPAPGTLVETAVAGGAVTLEHALETSASSGHLTILDLGTSLNKLTLAAMRKSDLIYVLTSGQSVANKLLNSFVDAAPRLELEPHRMLPVVNELHGRQKSDVELARVPVARIPQANEQSRARLWLRDQGLEKLMSMMVQ